MTRKIVSTTLLVSLIALASSGIMMIVLGSYEFNLRMHPVHKIFGITMTISGILHIYYNFKSIKKYLGSQKVLLFAVGMILFMLLLYFAGYKKPLDETIINEIEMSSSKIQK